MPVLYKVLPIEGKGLGVVASQFIKRGSLILKEQCQMPYPSSLNPSIQLKIDQLSCIQAKMYFDQMSQSDQKDYLELFDKYEHVNKDEKIKNEDNTEELSDLRSNLKDTTEKLNEVKWKL